MRCGSFRQFLIGLDIQNSDPFGMDWPLTGLTPRISDRLGLNWFGDSPAQRLNLSYKQVPQGGGSCTPPFKWPKSIQMAPSRTRFCERDLTI